MTTDVRQGASPQVRRDAVRVLVVHGVRLLGTSLAGALDTRSDMVAAWSAPDEGLVAAAAEADVLVVGLNGDSPGLSVLRELRRALPDVPLVALADRAGSAQVPDALRAGAVGALPITASLSDVATAVAVAGAGGALLQGDRMVTAVRRMLGTAPVTPSGAKPRHDVLTPREREVLRGLTTGRSTRELAEELGISLHTARTHVQNVLSKLGVHSQLEAAAYAADHDLV